MIATRAEGWLVFCSLGCSNDVLQSTSEQKNETEEVSGDTFDFCRTTANALLFRIVCFADYILTSSTASGPPSPKRGRYSFNRCGGCA